MNSPATTSFTALILKLIGVITILAALLDYITLAIPFEFQNRQWQLGLTTQYVDRGIVPLIGIALLLLGYWIGGTIQDSSQKKASGLNLKLPVFVLSSVLGLMFLLLVPVHLSNLNQASAEALERIEEGAGQGETQIQGFLQQLNVLSQDPQQLNQAIQQRDQVISTGEFQGRILNAQQVETLRQQKSQLEQLLDLSKNPGELETRLNDLKTQLETQLLDRKREREQQAKTQALKQGLRIGLSSLLLSIAFIAIGWFGLRGLGK